MYALVDRLDPDSLLALATAAFGELVLAGVTTVHEFHYLHQPAGMDDAVCEAARRAGIRLVLLDTCYLRAGFDGDAARPRAAAVQRRRRRAVGGPGREGRRRQPRRRRRRRHPQRAGRRPGVDGARWPPGPAPGTCRCTSTCPSSRPRTRRAVAATGRTPAQLADDHGVLGPSTTAVHCTHVTADDIALLGQQRHDRVPVPHDRARPRRRRRPGRARWPPPAARCGSAPTPTRSSTCSRRPGRSSSTSGWPPAAAGSTSPRRCWPRPPPAPPCGPASRPTCARSTSTASGSPASTPTTRCRCWSRRRPPPTCTDVVVAGRHVVRDGAHVGDRRRRRAARGHRRRCADVGPADHRHRRRQGHRGRGRAHRLGRSRRRSCRRRRRRPSLVGRRAARDARAGRLPHAPRVRRRPGGGVGAAPGGRRRYEEIAAAGGGIRSTVRATRAASDDELLDAAARRAAALAARRGHDGRGEVRLRARPRHRAADAAHRPADPRAGPGRRRHDVPRGPRRPARVRRRRRRLRRLRVRRGAPGRRGRGPGRRGRRLLRADRVHAPSRSTGCSPPRPRLGLPVKLHADQLSDGGGAALAARHRRPVGRPPRARVDPRASPRWRRRARWRCCCRAPPTCCATTPCRPSTPCARPACRWRSPPTATPARRRWCRCRSPCTSPAPASA